MIPQCFSQALYSKSIFRPYFGTRFVTKHTKFATKPSPQWRGSLTLRYVRGDVPYSLHSFGPYSISDLNTLQHSYKYPTVKCTNCAEPSLVLGSGCCTLQHRFKGFYSNRFTVPRLSYSSYPGPKIFKQLPLGSQVLHGISRVSYCLSNNYKVLKIRVTHIQGMPWKTAACALNLSIKWLES